jgi:hypothetical protein
VTPIREPRIKSRTYFLFVILSAAFARPSAGMRSRRVCPEPAEGDPYPLTPTCKNLFLAWLSLLNQSSPRFENHISSPPCRLSDRCSLETQPLARKRTLPTPQYRSQETLYVPDSETMHVLPRRQTDGLSFFAVIPSLIL